MEEVDHRLADVVLDLSDAVGAARDHHRVHLDVHIAWRAHPDRLRRQGAPADGGDVAGDAFAARP